MIGECLWLLLGMYVAYEGFFYTSTIFAQKQFGVGFKIPLGFVYLSIPVGFSLMCIRLIFSIMRRFREAKGISTDTA
jgi:TRAP-type C4-dicarboxylate transport system permease small subunit